jgi:carbon-monoxide dehydrogenase large subunit
VLRGRAVYLDDLERPGLLHAVFVRSPHARARVAAVRGDAITDIRGALPVQAPPGSWHAEAPHPLLGEGEVRYAAQPVALVLAGSRALAEDAAELVEVDYEPLDATAGEELLRFERTAGDVDGAFAAAAHVVRTEHRIPRLVAAPMETRGALAEYDADADLLTVHISAQDVHRPLAGLAHALDRPRESIRVVVPEVGGAFGTKGSLPPEAAIVAAAAIRTGRPVKWAEDRFENFLAAPQGRGVEAEVELALDADGRMLAVRARIRADIGAYLFANSAAPPHTMAMLMCGCYDIPAAQVTVVGERTDKVPTGPYRGAGRPEAAYVLERTVDAAARELGIDRLELRRRNFVREFPHRTPLGWTYDSGDYAACLDRAAELLGKPPAGAGLVGVGYGMYVERAGGQWESARVTVEPSGRVTARSSSNPHGQGHETTFAQIVADELGVEPGEVDMRFGDSADVPAGVGTFASRSTAMGGSALLLAAREVRETGNPTAEARFESDLVFSSGCYGAVVEVDPATGVVRVLRVVAVDDAGRIVNPLLAEGQVIGGTVQGLGAVLTEEMTHDESAQPTIGSFLDYGLLTAAEVPPIATAFVESPSPLNPLGAKGIGEGGAIGTPAAIANAIADALGGVRIDPPFTPEKVWEALR